MLHPCAAMPGSMIDRENDRGRCPRRISARHIPPVRGPHPWQALLWALARPGFAACGVLQQVRRPLPRHHMERRKTSDEVLVIPRADGGALALHPQRGPSGRPQRQAGFVLAPQPARPCGGFFFHTARAARASCCFWGAPRRE